MKVLSYTASGVSNSMMGAMNVTIGGTDNQVKRAVKNSKKTPKKPLNYNPREVSSALLRASKSRSAGQVLVQAKGKLGSLAKAKGSGQYLDAEVEAAIAHAKRMVRCAQMKTQNLRQEEQMAKRYAQQSKAEARQEINQAKARVIQKERNLEQKQEITEMQYKQKQKKMTRDLLQKRKKNRNQEQNKVTEADMEYLKKQIKNLGESYSDSSCSLDGVTVDLSKNGVQLSDAQLEQITDAMAGDTMGANSVGGGETGAGAEVATVNLVI